MSVETRLKAFIKPVLTSGKIPFSALSALVATQFPGEQEEALRILGSLVSKALSTRSDSAEEGLVVERSSDLLVGWQSKNSTISTVRKAIVAFLKESGPQVPFFMVIDHLENNFPDPSGAERAFHTLIKNKDKIEMTDDGDVKLIT